MNQQTCTIELYQIITNSSNYHNQQTLVKSSKLFNSASLVLGKPMTNTVEICFYLKLGTSWRFIQTGTGQGLYQKYCQDHVLCRIHKGCVSRYKIQGRWYEFQMITPWLHNCLILNWALTQSPVLQDSPLSPARLHSGQASTKKSKLGTCREVNKKWRTLTPYNQTWTWSRIATKTYCVLLGQRCLDLWGLPLLDLGILCRASCGHFFHDYSEKLI